MQKIKFLIKFLGGTMNAQDLKSMGIKPDISGWFDTKTLNKALSLIIEINKRMPTKIENEFEFDSFSIDNFNVEVFIATDEDGREFHIDIGSTSPIKFNKAVDKIPSVAISTAVMGLFGFKGTFSANKVAEIIEVANKENIDYSNWLSSQW